MSLLSVAPMPLRASISKTMMSATTSLSYPSGSPSLCNSHRVLVVFEARPRLVDEGEKSSPMQGTVLALAPTLTTRCYTATSRCPGWRHEEVYD